MDGNWALSRHIPKTPDEKTTAAADKQQWTLR